MTNGSVAIVEDYGGRDEDVRGSSSAAGVAMVPGLKV